MAVTTDLHREKELIERARNSPEAFGELYEQYYGQIFGYALRRTADVDIARDVTSATFFKALQSIRSYRWQGIPFSHWLYRVASREILNHHKRAKREPNYQTPDIEVSTAIREELISSENEMKKYENYLDLRDSISKLPLRYQEVITLKYFEDMDIKQISSIIGRPEGTIKSLLHRGIERLRKVIESEGKV